MNYYTGFLPCLICRSIKKSTSAAIIYLDLFQFKQIKIKEILDFNSTITLKRLRSVMNQLKNPNLHPNKRLNLIQDKDLYTNILIENDRLRVIYNII